MQQMFTILSRAETDIKRSSLGQMVFEMAILRLTETRPFKNIDNLIDKINQTELMQEQPSVALTTQSDPIVPTMQSTPSKTQSEKLFFGFFDLGQVTPGSLSQTTCF